MTTPTPAPEPDPPEPVDLDGPWTGFATVPDRRSARSRPRGRASPGRRPAGRGRARSSPPTGARRSARFDRWWLDGEAHLRALWSDRPRLDGWRDEHTPDLPAHVVETVVAGVVRGGPDGLPVDGLVTRADWDRELAKRCRAEARRRQRAVQSAIDGLALVDDVDAFVAAVAAVLVEVARPQVLLSLAKARELCHLALDVVRRGPDAPGGWGTPRGAGGGLAAAALVGWTALRLTATAATFGRDEVDPTLAADLAGASAPWASEAAHLLQIDGVGPIAVEADGRPITSPARKGPVLMFGPPGEGKTVTFAALLSTALGAVLLTTPKMAEMWDVLAVRRGGRVVLIDPTGEVAAPPWVERVGFDPLSRVHDLASARHLAHLTISRAFSAGSITEGSFWVAKAIDLAAPVILWVARTGGRLTEAVRALQDAGSWYEVELALASAGEEEASSMLREVADLDPRTRDSVATTAVGGMRTYADDLAGCVGDLPEVSARDLVQSGATVLVSASARGADHLAGYVVAVVDALVDAQVRLAGEVDGTRLDLLLDEAGTSVPHPDLPQLSSVVPALGVRIVAAFQALGQMTRIWGAGASELFDNAATTVVFPRTIDPVLRERIGSLLPPERVTDHDGRLVAVLPASLLRPPGPDEVVVVGERAVPRTARQVVPHRDPVFVGHQLEQALLHHPGLATAAALVPRPASR